MEKSCDIYVGEDKQSDILSKQEFFYLKLNIKTFYAGSYMFTKFLSKNI